MAQLTVEQALELAVQHHRAGRIAPAEEIYRAILAQQPDHADAMLHLGMIAHQAARFKDAEELFRRAISLKPDFAEAHYHLGNALGIQGRFQDAIASFRQAIALKPDHVDAQYFLGNALNDMRRFDEAIAAFRQAVALKPDYYDANYNLGVALEDSGRLDEAAAAYRRAIALNPTSIEAICNLGNVLKSLGHLDEAIVAYHRIIALKSNFPEAYSNLGIALKEKGQLDEAVVACSTAIALNSDFPDAYSNLGNALKDKGHLDEAIAAFRHCIALDPNYLVGDNNLVYTIHFHPGYDAARIAAEHHRWNRQHAEPLKKFIEPHANERNPNRRLRIGYVSPDFREHVVGRFVLPLLAHHDKSQVEVFAYSQALVPDAMTQRLRACADGWRNMVGLSDAQVADLIRQDRIDILVDLAMHTADGRLLVFARKPAPVQVTYLAYCSTTGMHAIDYRLSDPFLDPPGGDESIYSEATIRLPQTYWCYQPCIAPPEVGGLPALPNGGVTFGCLNNFCKITEPALAAWAKILRAVPTSKLLIHANPGAHRQRVLDRLVQEGIESRRVRFVGKTPMADYFHLYNAIDIALDTFPYAGGTTTCDALWMGTPVVSLVGKTAVGRGGLSILSNIGLPELAARSQEEYVRLAIELANDLPRLGNLRLTLRRRMENSPLMNAPKFARDIEAAYRWMWRQWVQTNPEKRACRMKG